MILNGKEVKYKLEFNSLGTDVQYTYIQSTV
jgi:hypothetical protein